LAPAYLWPEPEEVAPACIRWGHDPALHWLQPEKGGDSGWPSPPLAQPRGGGVILVGPARLWYSPEEGGVLHVGPACLWYSPEGGLGGPACLWFSQRKGGGGGTELALPVF
jgi:hypothetical protein